MHAEAVLVFGAALPLAIWTATIYRRLRTLGVTAPGTVIGLAGGILAAASAILAPATAEVREDIAAELPRFRAIRQKHGLPVPDDDKHLEALAAEGRVLLAFTPDGPSSDWTSWGLD
jgi:hypothetical protein